MNSVGCEIGIAGPSTMALALNIADHGYSVAALDDETAHRGPEFGSGERRIELANDVVELISLLAAPRTVVILAGPGFPVDKLINALVLHLASRDLVIDAGDSYFKDTDARSRMLARRGIQFLGVGIRGGEDGARHGVSITAGGSARGYDRVRLMLQDIASEANDEPCVAYVGPRSSGHYVNMVHNGVEHGLTQLIAETYDLMSRGLGMSDVAIQRVYANWCASEVNSSLLGILAGRLRYNNNDIGAALSDLIANEITRNGSARWASIEARVLGVPTPTIDVAVAIDMLCSLEEGRAALRKPLGRRPIGYVGKPDFLVDQMKRALCAGMIVTFAQGLALLRVASDEYQYDLPLEAVAHVWRGSILRSPMLREIYDAYCLQPRLQNLLSDSQFAHQSWSRHDDLRAVVRLAKELGIPAPALTASLTYYDTNRQISAQTSSRCEQPDASIGLRHAERERDGLPADSLISHSS